VAEHSFDFERLIERLGIPFEQLEQNLSSYMESAQELIKKYPNKKLSVDLQFGKLAILRKKHVIKRMNYTQTQQSDEDLPVDNYMPKETVSTKSLTKNNLNSEFGMFKRNPSVALSHRSYKMSSNEKIQKKNKLLSILNKRVQMNHLGEDDFDVKTPRSHLSRTGLKTAQSARSYMFLRNKPKKEYGEEAEVRSSLPVQTISGQGSLSSTLKKSRDPETQSEMRQSIKS
jgi:hypothetical protein